jgi:hypothetical protein
MKDWKTMELGELLTLSELRKVKEFMDADDEKGLREYLNKPELKDKLYKKGVLSYFLFYVLLSRRDEIKKLGEMGL